MKKPLTTCLLFVLGILNLFALDNRSSGARPLALSNAYVSISDVWSTFHNQAGLAQIDQFSAGIYFESRYLIDELSLSAGTVILPVDAGTFSLSIYQFGKGTYKENKLGFAFAKQLSEHLSVGLQFDYFSNRFPENKKAFGFGTFELGIIYAFNKNLFLGGHVFNPVSGGIKTYQGKINSPTIFRIGGHYQFDDMVMIIFETQKDLIHPFQFKTGIEFVPIKNLAFRCGYSGKPFNYTGGLGYSFGKIITDIGFAYHGNLGITPTVSLQFLL